MFQTATNARRRLRLRRCSQTSRSSSWGRLPSPSSHRTVQVLFTYGSSGPQVFTPTAGRFTASRYPSGNMSCSGAAVDSNFSRQRSFSDTSPRSAKYALRSARSTADV